MRALALRAEQRQQFDDPAVFGVVLEPGDRLLCFGRLEEIRSMIPDRRKRRTKVRKLPRLGLGGRRGLPSSRCS